uniref:(northern house mosquito) hypothetical protein n=1 Tax=Culex pipiens TaxID=7175 RepID=A0A8D8AKE1_CULPI
MSSIVLSFPAEILEAIFAYLPLKDLLNASQVCHRWNKVLQSPLFQRQLQVKLHSEFRDLPSKADEAFLSRAKNLSIVQKFNEDEPEGENGQAGPAEAKENISGILFGACNELECLQLISRFQCVKSVIGDRLDELSNLRELSLSFAYQGEEKCDELQGELWLMRSNSLQSFKIGLTNSLGPFGLEAPNLKEMHLTVNCKTLLDLVDKFSGQLRRLRLKLIVRKTLDEILKMKFSKLNQLELAIFDHKDSWEFSHVTVREEDDELVKQFVQEMSTLEELSVRSDEVFYRLCPALCSMQTNLRQLELHNLNVDSNILINILLIQNIKSLSVQHCEIVNEIPGLHIRLVNLLHLNLTNVVNNVLMNHNFSGLKSLQLLHNRFGNESLQKVFQNFTSIEQLQITFRAKLDADAFARLHQLKNLTALTLCRTDTTAEHWKRIQPVPSVRQLTFEGCFMMPLSIFPELGRVFPALRRLHVTKCCVLDDTSSADAVVDGACERKLREMFPGVAVSWHETMQITPENLKKMLL